jgi:hypothetical protein
MDWTFILHISWTHTYLLSFSKVHGGSYGRLTAEQWSSSVWARNVCVREGFIWKGVSLSSDWRIEFLSWWSILWHWPIGWSEVRFHLLLLQWRVFFFFARVACQLELLELTAFTQPSALAACLQAATARLPCVLCSAPTPTRRRQRPRTRHAFVWKHPVASCLVDRSPSPPSSTSSPATANWQPERGRQAGYSSTPYAAAALRDQPRSPAPARSGSGGYGPIMAW